MLGGAQLLSSHRAYCHGAVMDNLPLALIEPLSYGRPILAAPVGGIPEIFRDGVEGYYWNLDGPDEGAAKLTQLLETSTLRTMSRAARARSQATFAESASFSSTMLTGNLERHGRSGNKPLARSGNDSRWNASSTPIGLGKILNSCPVASQPDLQGLPVRCRLSRQSRKPTAASKPGERTDKA